MDVVRYLFALLWLVTLPVLIFWLALHPFVAFWRRMGLGATYVILLVACVTVSVVLFRFRGALLAVEYGAKPPLWVLAALSYGTAVFIEVRCRRHLTIGTLVGVPELRGSSQEDRLLTEGIYGTVRHPRYLGVVFGYIASALFANYLFLYAAFPVLLITLHLVVVLEEAELEERFGERYRAYRTAVPRYVPRLVARSGRH